MGYRYGIWDINIVIYTHDLVILDIDMGREGAGCFPPRVVVHLILLLFLFDTYLSMTHNTFIFPAFILALVHF